ncbi:hypothetical protein ABC628_01085 [Lentilactobacillus otakiensis]|nr:hypothetical protein [Lentilactobacillus otakiensis]MBZ3775511.1 hypothetical protein [Lentilactobacillus otakiensis]MDV3518196.1 hypothetical protein [Lentilactobacillus otakiensis]
MNDNFLSGIKLKELTQRDLLATNGGKRSTNMKSVLRHFEKQYLNGIL